MNNDPGPFDEELGTGRHREHGALAPERCPLQRDDSLALRAGGILRQLTGWLEYERSEHPVRSILVRPPSFLPSQEYLLPSEASQEGGC